MSLDYIEFNTTYHVGGLNYSYLTLVSLISLQGLQRFSFLTIITGNKNSWLLHCYVIPPDPNHKTHVLEHGLVLTYLIRGSGSYTKINSPLTLLHIVYSDQCPTLNSALVTTDSGPSSPWNDVTGNRSPRDPYLTRIIMWQKWGTNLQGIYLFRFFWWLGIVYIPCHEKKDLSNKNEILPEERGVWIEGLKE